MSPISRRGILRVALILALFALTAPPVLLPGSPAKAAERNEAAAGAAIGWLAGQQRDNGGFPGFSGDADPSTTTDAVYALAAAGIDPNSVTSASGASPIDHLVENAAGVTGDSGPAARLTLALHAAGYSTDELTDVNGVDLTAELVSLHDPATGRLSSTLYMHVYVLLALEAAGLGITQDNIEAVLEDQLPDGSWGFNWDTPDGAGDSNTTALVIQALAALPEGGEIPGQVDEAISAGLAYLRSVQAADGSFAFDGSADPLVGDANSTALAIQAFVAAGVELPEAGDVDPVEALATFQLDNGALFWQPDFPDPNMLATVQAIPALLLTPLPVGPVSEAPDSGMPVAGSLQEAIEPASANEGCDFYTETQHNLCGSFAAYWHASGGLKIFGFPLTEPYQEGELVVQYFERARFEWHPDLAGTEWEVLLGRLGADALDEIVASE